MRLLLSCWFATLVVVGGCTRSSADRDSGSAAADMGAIDVGRDAPTLRCSSDPDCADSFACTLDQCVVGNTCMHTPIDAMCNVSAGERCDPVVGCTAMSTCNTAADCDDHVFCNGTESCSGAHQCYHLADRNCDDGNACTTDACDTAADSCAYTTICDSGVGPMPDAGPSCTAFTAPDDFNGTYTMLPAQSQACGGANYTVSQLTISVSGTTVTVTTGPSGAITMTGTLTSDSFDVTGTSGSGSYHLTGTFACRERFMGHWTATVRGIGCSNQDVDVRGSRR